MANSVNDCLLGRENNFDFIRFLAALFVIFSHAYFLTPHGITEPLMEFTGGRYSIGDFCVFVFFVISGMLITRSYERSKSLLEYASSRALRIYPALFVVTIITVFVVGPWMTTVDLWTYFTSGATLKYLTNAAALRYSAALPGVFEHNPFPVYVNGSLWTLPSEILCYCLVTLVGAFRAHRVKQFVIIAVLLSIVFSTYFYFFALFYRNAYYFLCGALIYAYRKDIILNGKLAFFAALLLLGNIHFNANAVFSHFVSGITLSYVVVYLSFFKTSYFKNFAKHGDFSYGIYIWAFLIQQILVVKMAYLGVMEHFLVASGFSLILAFLSWHLIEKKALTWKQYFKGKEPKPETVNRRGIFTVPAS